MALNSQNVYIKKLINIENKYPNTYHKIIKMIPTDVKSTMYFNFFQNSKLLTISKYQDEKYFLKEFIFQISQRKFSFIKQLIKYCAIDICNKRRHW